MEKNKCEACEEIFAWNDDVVVVDDKYYHKECVTLVPMGYYALLGDEPLGEVENGEGQMAFEVFENLILEDEK